MSAYDELARRMREIALLKHATALLHWDQETAMPEKGGARRAEALAELTKRAHEAFADERIGELLEAAASEPAVLDDEAKAADVRELRRDYERERKLPAALVAEFAEQRSLAQQAWVKARAASDFAAFAPHLETLIGLARRQAECLGAPEDGELWDALLDIHEPGLRARSLESLFARLVAGLRPLVESQRGRRRNELAGLELPIPAQEALCRRVATALGYDFAAGRLDRSAHPFTIALHPGDVRITTRYREDDVLDALGSTIHETGHALYEQGLPDAPGLPRGEAASTGIHESQSRLWENQVGRSLPFQRWLAPLLREAGGPAFAGVGPDELFASWNRVEPSLIRVEADETTYNLHIAVRFELELALFRGELPVAELPAAWNARYRDFLGVEPESDRDGCLQDIHWSLGLFGYFPTYTLGNLYAAQIWEALRAAEPELDAAVAGGDFAPILGFLRREIHALGRRYPPGELCRRVSGQALDPEVFLRYLRAKLET